MAKKKVAAIIAEIFFICLCLFGLGYSVYRYLLVLNESLTKKEAIAVIAYKKNNSQRKLKDGDLWDRLQTGSSVYNEDTVRTAPLSEAWVDFSGGNILELHEDSQAKILLRDNKPEIEIEYGKLNADSANSSGMNITSGIMSVNMDKQTSISADTNPSDVTLQVQKGNASIVNTQTGHTIMRLQSGETAKIKKDGTVEKSALTITQPDQESKYLSFSSPTVTIPFEWKYDFTKTSDATASESENDENENEIILELFNSKSMTEPVQSYSFNNVNSANVEVPAGNYWWKLSIGQDICTGKISAVSSKKPELIAHAADFTASYRSKTPDIRFAWTGSENASQYELTIADNPNFKNPLVSQRTEQTSCIISSLGKGTWYWKVTPYYAFNNIGLSNASESSSFVILRSDKLEKIQLQKPAQDEIVSTKIKIKNQEPVYNSIIFTWKDNPEALSYEFRLWPEKARNGAPGEITKTVTQSYVAIDTSKEEINSGTWLWQVTRTDSEGRKDKSEVRQFFAVESEVEHKTTFPPEGYKLLQTHTQDITFRWKTNIIGKTTVQIARDAAFKDIIYSLQTSGNSAYGKPLEVGTYYWRITTSCQNKTDKDAAPIIYTTPAKTLIVKDFLEAPEITTPKEGSREIVRTTIPVKFQWKTVPDADYYQLKLYTQDNPLEPIYEKNYIKSEDGKYASDLLIMDYMPETIYNWTVQAFSEESPLSSRFSGKTHISTFKMRILKPVKLLLPLNGTSFDGIFAITDPASFVWSSIEAPVKSKIVIYKDLPEEQLPEEENAFSTINRPKYKQRMPKLYEGQYYWTVVAYTADDIDISATVINNFSVREMPKLPVPEMISPKDDLLINIDYIINNGIQVDFKWGKMNGIARYIFRIFKKEDPSPLFEVTLPPDQTEFHFEGDDFANTLGKYNGGWQWSVEAQTDYEGELLQKGATKKIPFTVNIPKTKPEDVVTSEEKEIRYGLDEDFEPDANIEQKIKNAKKKTPKKKKTSAKSKKSKKMGVNS
ncbi:MAG: FecR domain-containing protein [Treponema sp.]|nr:FecR domain-containing protein [Treponema sp.]